MKFFRAVNILGYVVMFWFFIVYVLLEKPPLRYSNLPFPVMLSPVKDGEVAKIRVSRCNDDDHTRLYLVARSLIHIPSGDSIVMPATTVSIEPGCRTVVSSVNVVPVGTPAGKYFIKGVGEVNGLVRTHTVSWSSEAFDVVN